MGRGLGGGMEKAILYAMAGVALVTVLFTVGLVVIEWLFPRE
jgi:hypothetical protein